MFRRFDFLVDLAAMTLAVGAGIIVTRRFLDSRAAHALDATPVGSLVTAVRGAWAQV